MNDEQMVLAGLARVVGPICDDCLAEEARLTRRQVANKYCNRLGLTGRIGRGKATCKSCGKSKRASWPGTSRNAPIAAPRRTGGAMIGKTAERMNQRVQQLIRGLSKYVGAFDSANLFTGPSVYFHLKTLERLRGHSSATEALADEQFVESIYATLAAWGMHRMGPRGARMVPFADFKAGLQQQAPRIHDLETLHLTNLATADVERIGSSVWEIIDGLRVGVGETRIVAGAKTLHHVLPELVPPIDRQYTIRFFYQHTNLNRGDECAFKEVFPQFHKIGVARRREIESFVGVGLNTSATKVIDNAIVGYGLKHLRPTR